MKEQNKDTNFFLTCFMYCFKNMWCHDFRRCMEGSVWFSWRFFTWVWSRSYGIFEQICRSVTIGNESGTVWTSSIAISFRLESSPSIFSFGFSTSMPCARLLVIFRLQCIHAMMIAVSHIICRLQKVCLNSNQHHRKTVNSARIPTAYPIRYWYWQTCIYLIQPLAVLV